MQLPKGILFDLDDTIIAFDSIAEQVWESVCSRYAPRVGGCDSLKLHEAIRRAGQWYWSDDERHHWGRLHLAQARREIVRQAFGYLELDHPSLADEIADAFTAARFEAAHLFPGALETLRELKKRGVRLAMITNGATDVQWQKIKRFELEPYFEAILVEGDLGYGKPDPRVYRGALDALGLEPSEAWMVGDNLHWDVAGPQRLGIYSIWNDHRKQGLPKDSPVIPDRVIHAIAELIEG